MWRLERISRRAKGSLWRTLVGHVKGRKKRKTTKGKVKKLKPAKPARPARPARSARPRTLGRKGRKGKGRKGGRPPKSTLSAAPEPVLRGLQLDIDAFRNAPPGGDVLQPRMARLVTMRMFTPTVLSMFSEENAFR